MGERETNLARAFEYDDKEGTFAISGWHLRQLLREAFRKIDDLEKQVKRLQAGDNNLS